jgi:hypothetical protein
MLQFSGFDPWPPDFGDTIPNSLASGPGFCGLTFRPVIFFTESRKSWFLSGRPVLPGILILSLSALIPHTGRLLLNIADPWHKRQKPK